jgi:TolB-like protein/DNA-binding winged helix-turn-helix (wHTH) protein
MPAMQYSAKIILRIGEWRVDPASGEISRGSESARVEARTMRLLMCLASRAGETVSIDDLLNEVWEGVNVSPDSVYQAITSLRRVLGDDPRRPAYIATVPRLGYRLLATVSPWDQTSEEPVAAQSAPHQAKAPRPAPLFRSGLFWGVAAGICVVLAGAYLFRGPLMNNSLPATPAASQPQKSIAVLPFLDLTEGMKNEEFADGMTEELIDKLSNIPGLRVPSATASFYFKNKRVPPGEIASRLGVAYLLDGSVRKSGARLRVAARLVGPENGYVLWSETYDRPINDMVGVQDNIAGEVAKALKQSIIVAAPSQSQAQ